MANLNFNAHEVEPNAAFDPLPAGKYLAVVTATEMRPTKDGGGSYLNVELTILEGPYKDRKVWDRLCLNHSNPQTVKLARGSLSALCRAVGVMQPRDSVELHNIPLVATVKLKKREDNGEMANQISSYSKKEAAAGQPQQGQSSTPPWRR